ncbi:hypothetical protein [Chitiniphilus eburneus]|uniref:DUF3313 domain-containing protein n=1 Tax=Chitiniphilus eburneus TaxID=2571148 RepID=A0A4U0PXA5_9NEIS|nr:hypothetical protein [Chitiniphilus eburneus]TJZ73213.1 hypothetical protein FAZ21_11385 [Chitiniphilus eburneus]
MKRLITLAIPIFLTACASAPPVKFSVNDLDKSQIVAFQDVHPADENTQEVFSYIITSERYGIYRLGNIATDPSAMRLLQHRIYERFGESTPTSVKVHHFVVYQNMQGSLRAGTIGSVFGVLGAVIASSVANNDLGGSAAVIDPVLFTSTAGDNEWKRGISSVQENPNNGASLVTWLDVEINGKRVFVRSVSPLKVPDSRIPYVVALESTYDYLLKQF